MLCGSLCRGYGRAMVQRMTAAGEVPHFHFHDDVRMERLMYLRSELRTEAKARGIRLTVLPFIIKVHDGHLWPA